MKSGVSDVMRAFAYFTIVPVPQGCTRLAPGAGALAALPVAGACIGALAGFAGWGASIALGSGIGIAVALAVQLGLTGFLHVDGFLDSCDALFATVSVQRRHEILKDPAHGTYAVGGMALLTVLWIAALGSCAPQRLPLYLAFSAAASRACAIAMTPLFPYAGFSAASPLAQRSFATVIVLLLAGLVVAGIFVSHTAWAAPLLAAGFALSFASWAGKRLGGGLTGDVYGFLISVLEPLVLIVVAVRT